MENYIAAEGAISLGEALKGNQTLIKLEWDSFDLIWLTMNTSLSVSVNDIGDEGVIAISEALKENFTLTELE